MIKVVLVDDEPQSSKALAIKLKAIAEDIDIIRIYYNPVNSIAIIRKLMPFAVFLNIEMHRMNVIQMIEKMEEFKYEDIFETAYDEYTPNELRISALDYFLKPVDNEDLTNA